MDGVPNNPPQMNGAFLTSSFGGVNVTNKGTMEMKVCAAIFLQYVV
jgi:hypothetical protein